MGSAWAALNTTKKRKEKENFYLVDVHLGCFKYFYRIFTEIQN